MPSQSGYTISNQRPLLPWSSPTLSLHLFLLARVISVLQFLQHAHNLCWCFCWFFCWFLSWYLCCTSWQRQKLEVKKRLCWIIAWFYLYHCQPCIAQTSQNYASTSAIVTVFFGGTLTRARPGRKTCNWLSSPAASMTQGSFLFQSNSVTRFVKPPCMNKLREMLSAWS